MQRPSVSADGRRFVLPHRPDGAFCSVLDAWALVDGRWTGPRRVESEGCPDRAVLDGAGRRIVFASGRTGIAALYLADFDGGEARQLTNVGLETAPLTPGSPPPGFIAPPHLGPPTFDGDFLHWLSPDGPQRIRLP